jgi:DNA-directed RNA polymerase specialized sigma24 family protein
MKPMWNSDEESFVQVAFAAVPRIAEIIAAFPPEHRAGALEVAERRYTEAARDFGCAEVASRTRIADIMRNLRTQVEIVAA